MLGRHYANRLINLRPFPAAQYGCYSTSSGASSGSISYPPRVLSGIQPTGVPHIGNYLGALRQWVDLQSSSKGGIEPFFSIVDLHALTVPQDPNQLREWRKQSLAALLAIGLDPLHGKSCLFYQSDVPEHSELMWILSTIASTGYLSRMTQWKSKLDLSEDETLNSETTKAKLKLGLFSYPVLQAADILLYRATAVPVGEDQKQHLEFARTLAGSFNHTFGEVFPLPDPMILSTSRILSLRPHAPLQTEPSTNPVSITRLPKMSKSHPDPRSRILITDAPQEILSKVRAAVTDSDTSSITYDPVARPGVSNLLSIYASVRRDTRALEQIAEDDFSSKKSVSSVAGKSSDNKMKILKEQVAESVIKGLEGVREQYEETMGTKAGKERLQEVAERGKAWARAEADKTMAVVRGAMGLR